MEKVQKVNRKECTAFVLGGGGSRGALQVGAMRALFEADIFPDLLVGTSIGAVNAVGLALWGVNINGLETLEWAWEKVADVQLLDPRVSQLVLRAVLGRPTDRSRSRIEKFFKSLGIHENLCFGQISDVRLALISADLESGQPVIHGEDVSESLLEGLLSSIALPPWFTLIKKGTQIIMDGGALSNLAIEPALRLGATEIIALDLDDTMMRVSTNNLSLAQLIQKYFYAVSRRNLNLEMALASAHGVPVHCIELRNPATDPIWDFSDYRRLIDVGYEITAQSIAYWGWDKPLEKMYEKACYEKQSV